MDWYSIKFYDFEIQKEKDKEFTLSIKRLIERSEESEGLALFKNNHTDTIYKYYYLSIPENFPVEPKKLFESYRIAKTFPPDLMRLEQLAGKKDFTDDSN